MCSSRRHLRWTLPALLLCGVAASCGPRPMAGTKGCQRQVDCLGREVCDPRTHECVSETTVDAGPCAATLNGCADDGLNNRATQCAAPVANNGKYFSNLLMCPGATDYFRVDAQAGWPLQVLAWPTTAKDLSLNVVDGSGAAVASENTANNGLAFLSVTALDGGSYTLAVVASDNAEYDLQVLTGEHCVTDTSCPSGRCDPLIPDPYNTSGPVPDSELTRGGVCVAKVDSLCGDVQPGPNVRSEPFAVGGHTPFQTCLKDVDWGQLELSGSGGFDVNLSLQCSSSAVVQQHLMLISPNNEVEWAAVLPDTTTASAVTIPKLPAGTHQLRLAQISGPDVVAACTLIVGSGPNACVMATDCPALATRFGRTRCVGGACVR